MERSSLLKLRTIESQPSHDQNVPKSVKWIHLCPTDIGSVSNNISFDSLREPKKPTSLSHVAGRPNGYSHFGSSKFKQVQSGGHSISEEQSVPRDSLTLLRPLRILESQDDETDVHPPELTKSNSRSRQQSSCWFISKSE